METAQGPFSALSPMEFATAPGLPGLSTINELGANPSMGADHTLVAGLTSYADEINQMQALTEAIRASRTDMLAAVPAQQYINDTRNSKWTITNTQNGFSAQGEATCYLSSAQCVDVQSTRVSASMSISLPAVPGAAATDFFILPELLPLMLYTYGLQIGQNGNVLQDPGTATDQAWLTQARAAKRAFDKSDLVFSTMRFQASGAPATIGVKDGSGFRYETEPNAYTSAAGVESGIAIPATAAAQTIVMTYTFRPTHAFFGIAKTWPPNVPLKLIIRWNPSVTSQLITAPSTATNITAALLAQVAINLRIHTIRSDEIYLVPGVRNFIMNHFDIGPQTNLNPMQVARTMNKAAYFDPTWGVPNFNEANIAAIYQFETFRLSSHVMSGNAFQIHPVLNGSARPTVLVFAVPHSVLAYSASLTPAAGVTLQSLQILYNGQTVWDEPYTQVTDVNDNLEPLYAESRRYADAERGIGWTSRPWWNYEAWAADHAFVVVKLGASHNPDEIQPNMSAPVEIRGQFTGPLPNPINLRVALFFDQTMLLQKNNTAVFSLPIY